MTTTCCRCGIGLKVPAQFTGKKIRCPKCKELIPVPAMTEKVLAAPPDDETEDEEPPRAEQETPPGELVDHRGERLPDDAEFFVAPPAAIGPVLSGYTTLRKGKRHTPLWLVLTAPVLGGAAGIAFGIWLSGTSASMGSIWRYLFPVIFGLLGSGLVFLIFLFSERATYVGKEGIALYDCFLSRNILSIKDVVCFREAADLYTFTVVHYVNGAYSSTDYIYTWYSAQNKLVYNLMGTYHSENGKPAAEDKFNFAAAAENAWTNYLLPIALSQLDDPGYIQFNIDKLFGTSWVRLDRKKLTFKLKSKPTRISAGDVVEAELSEGILTFRLSLLTAAPGQTPGSHQLKLNDLANRQLFLRLLKQLYGFKVA